MGFALSGVQAGKQARKRQRQRQSVHRHSFSPGPACLPRILPVLEGRQGHHHGHQGRRHFDRLPASQPGVSPILPNHS